MNLDIDVHLPRNRMEMHIDCIIKSRTTGIHGPSGAGKSSLFNMIAGLTHPSSGRILLDGKTLVDAERNIRIPAHRRHIGMVFQEKLLFPHLTVRKNLLFSARPRCGKSPREIRQAFETAVAVLDLESILDSRPQEISGGEAQRTAIGRTLLSFPRLMLLDEPFSAIDTSLRYNIIPYLKAVQEEFSIPMLIISHEMKDLLFLTTDIITIRNGRIIHGSQ
jgi:molybdate transport system ATP-binding protein